MNHSKNNWRDALSLFNPRLRFPIHAASDHYNPARQQFYNTPPTQRVKRGATKALWEMLRYPERHRPAQALPMQQPDWADFFAPSSRIKFIWLGHSSFLIRSRNKTLLLDPVYYTHASPIPVFMKRFQAAPVALNELPQIDLIVYTHAHYDHLDHQVVRYFAHHFPYTPYLAPLGMGTYLQSWGVNPAQITELDWQQSHDFYGTQIHTAPARHDASRSAFDGKKSLWLSYILQTEHEQIYLSGDSTYAPHFAQIGQQYGGFDLALIENGQYNENWRDNHMFPEQTVQAAIDLQAKKWMPIHWGAYPLAPHAWDEPVNISSQLSDKAGLVMCTPMMGQVFDANSDFSRWWQEIK